jgi:hypothetical protein
MKRLAGYNIIFDHSTSFLDALARFAKIPGTFLEKAPSPHAQAVFDTWRAAAREDESTGRKMIERHLFYGGAGAGSVPVLTPRDQISLNKDNLPLPPRSTVPELWGTLPQPQRDSFIGYITATEARTQDLPLMMLSLPLQML